MNRPVAIPCASVLGVTPRVSNGEILTSAELSMSRPQMVEAMRSFMAHLTVGDWDSFRDEIEASIKTEAA